MNGDWTRLNSCEPFYWDKAYDMWVATDYDIVREIAERNYDFVTSQGVLEPWQPLSVPVLHTCEGAEHSKLRALIAPSIVSLSSTSFGDRLRKWAASAACTSKAKGSCALIPDIAYPLASEVVFSLLNIPDLDRPALAKICRNALSSSTQPLEAKQSAAIELVSYIATLANLRRSSSPLDLVGKIASSTMLNDEAVIRNCRLLLEAGIESTCDAIVGSALELESMGFHGQFSSSDLIEEIFRKVSPVARFGRVAARHTTVAGFTISAGDRIMLSWYAANHGPTFASLRGAACLNAKSIPHLAFGIGVHRCPGASLARMAVQIFIEEVLMRWGHWDVTQMRVRPGSATHGWEHVRLRL